MSRIARREFLRASGAATALSLLGIGSAQADQGNGDGSREATRDDHPATETKEGLVGTWTASSQQATEEAGFTDGFNNQTIRNIVRTSVGGSDARIRLANTFGEDPLTIDTVSVGIWDMDKQAVQGSIHPVTFSGSRSVTMPPGARAYSDPVSLDVPPEQNIAVNLYAANPTGPPTTHADNRKTSYLASGNHVNDTDNEAFDSPAAGESDVLTAWFFLDGVDVVNPETAGAVVCLGNSITDGVGSSLDTDSTYPDFLAERLNDTDRIQKSVLNAGIGGNMILNDREGGGKSALARLDRDVIAQTGVTDVILLEGINDIDNEPLASADQIIWGMKQIIARVHAKGLNIFGATLTPAGYVEGADWERPEEFEAHRQNVNEWIRTSGAFDGVFDFDNALKDPDNPRHLLPKYDSGDGVHPSDAGYRKMAETVDLEELANKQNKDKSASRSKSASLPR